MNQCECGYHGCQQGRNCIYQEEDDGYGLIVGTMNALLITFAAIVIGLGAYAALRWMGLV